LNAYEQLLAIKSQLEENGAHEDSVSLVEKFIKRAEAEKDSRTSIAQSAMIRHLLRQREALDNDAIFNDMQELLDVHENRKVDPDAVRPAYEDNERRPKPHSYYRALKDRKPGTDR